MKILILILLTMFSIFSCSSNSNRKSLDHSDESIYKSHTDLIKNRFIKNENY